MFYTLLFSSLIFLAAYVPMGAFGAHCPESQPKITVIGAGLAGLTTAYRLQKMGYSCEVYEARNRPGGRVFTAYFGDSYEELGGQNIYDGGDGETMLALIAEMGLETETYDTYQEKCMSLDGKIISIKDLFQEAPEPSASFLLALQAKVSSAKNLADLIDPFFTETKIVRNSLELAMRSWEGSSTYALAPEYLDESFWQIYTRYYDRVRCLFVGEKPHSLKCSVKGGNSRLIRTLEQRLKRHMHYNNPLRKITRSLDKIGLHFDDHILYTDYLILTLPCTTLCDIDIEKDIFPEDQMQAIQTLQYGTNAKLLFPIHSKNPIGSRWAQVENMLIWLNKESSVMTWFYGGEPGIFHSCSVECLNTIMHHYMPYVLNLFPEIAFLNADQSTVRKELLFAQYEQPVGISWVDEEFSKGSYSNYSPGTFASFNTFTEDHQESVRTVFRSIDSRIFFAGEHTAPEGDNGTMDGAVYSGERAARMVQRALECVLKS